MKTKQPFFIFIEGADGTGKTTTSKNLETTLIKEFSKSVNKTLIMQSTEAGTILRQIAVKDDSISDELKFLSFCFGTFYGLEKNRHNHTDIDFVIIDRSHASTFAQSICAANIPEKTKTNMVSIFRGLNENFKETFKDQYLFVNLISSPTHALERLHKDRGEFDVLELRGVKYQEKIKHGYNVFFSTYIDKKNTVTIKTDEFSPSDVITIIIAKLLEKRKLQHVHQWPTKQPDICST